jgi:hypothetical protein
MRPLLLEYIEKTDGKPLDFSMVEYSYEQNLTVLKNSNIPAVKFMPIDTITFTKADGESSDTDAQPLSSVNELKNLLDTRTETKTFSEVSDSDASYMSKVNDLKVLLDTSTQTLISTEISDSDSKLQAFISLLDTKTLTENVENSDSDK